MVTPVISLDKSINGYLKIDDITTYTTGQRALTGIMMFWSSDAFAADVNLDQSNADSWNVPVVAQETVNVYGFYCYTWDVLNNVSLNQYSVVFYGGYFYIQTTIGVLNPSIAALPPPMDPTNWSLLVVGQALTIGMTTYASLSEADIYALAVLSTQQNSPTAVSTTALTFIDSDAFVLTKMDCQLWDITVNISCTIVSTKILNYDGTVLTTSLAVDGTTIHVDLTPYGDGSYLVEVAYVLSQGNISIPTYWLTVAIPILETCKANACYTKLFKYVLCKCDDPCDPCEDMTAKKHDLQIIRELITSINQMVNLQRSQYVGLYPISTSESDLLTDIGQMIDKLKIVTDRCGLCGGSSTLDITC